MIEVEIPKDITKVETKFMGLITAKQAIGLVIGLILTYIARKLIGSDPRLADLKALVTFVLIGVPLAFAIFKPYGMSMYSFTVQFLFTTVLSPKKRVYKVENKFEKEIEDEIRHENFIIYQYDRMHGIKHRNAKIDKNERPQIKPNKKKSLTGFI